MTIAWRYPTLVLPVAANAAVNNYVGGEITYNRRVVSVSSPKLNSASPYTKQASFWWSVSGRITISIGIIQACFPSDVSNYRRHPIHLFDLALEY